MRGADVTQEGLFVTRQTADYVLGGDNHLGRWNDNHDGRW